MKLVKGVALLSSALLLAACGGDDDDDNDSPSLPTTYSFESKIVDGESSVSHTGQSTRHLLINELKNYIGKAGENGETEAQILANLNRIYAKGTTDTTENLTEFDVYTNSLTATDINISLADTQASLQANYSDVSDDKKLQNKLAGCDNDLTNDFIGWTIESADLVECGQKLADGEVAVLDEQDKPHTLIQMWFEQIAARAAAGEGFVTADYLDLQQLVQKFLLGAVTYSQAAEDYMKATKGLVKQNETEDGQDKTYTSLEHQWDEGFGYFGASRDYLAYTDSEMKGQPGNDTNGDGKIDLMAGEYSYGHSINASKRDAGSADQTAATDFSTEAMTAFIAGRKLINDNVGNAFEADDAFHTELVGYAETALGAWEKAIAATVVHYINDVIADMAKLGTAEEDLDTLAKHWAEMKGFALSLQFSPVAIISMADLGTVHTKMGELPVVAADGVADYEDELLEARDILQAAYSFDETVVANW